VTDILLRTSFEMARRDAGIAGFFFAYSAPPRELV